MSTPAVVFSATGTIQTYVVPTAGTYRIEAAGGQGGTSTEPGGKGGIVSGMFLLRRGETLNIVAGRQGAPATPPHQTRGGRGGSSLVWIGQTALPNPIKLMLSARGGRGGSAPPDPASEPPFPGAAPANSADAQALVAANAEIDPPTVDALVTQWTRIAPPSGQKSAADAGRTDRAGYVSGAFRQSRPAAQEGPGYVSVTPVTVPTTTPASADAPAAPAHSTSEKTDEVPTVGMLPSVTPRPSSWKDLFRRPR